MSKPNLQPLMSAATSLTLGMLSACSFQPLDSAEVAGLANHPVTAVQGSQACSESLGQDGGNAGPQFLDAGAIDLVVWNIHKTRHKDSLSDLASLAEGTELILLQEAPLDLTDNHNLSLAGYQSFAPGFRSGKQLTGVMTLSKTEPLTNCTLQSREPWIRTPKAVGVTEYALSDSQHTLAVVNIHGINFTLGSKEFARQLDDISTALASHQGPLIVAGDFNTWNNRRLLQLERIAAQLKLEELTFDVDHRVRPFSRPVDKILVRGLKAHSATTAKVETSDHNPLIVRLSL